ncbi:hypothetical protein CS8_001130 [Cupriavidus sp. 8B]
MLSFLIIYQINYPSVKGIAEADNRQRIRAQAPAFADNLVVTGVVNSHCLLDKSVQTPGVPTLAIGANQLVPAQPVSSAGDWVGLPNPNWSADTGLVTAQLGVIPNSALSEPSGLRHRARIAQKGIAQAVRAYRLAPLKRTAESDSKCAY